MHIAYPLIAGIALGQSGRNTHVRRVRLRLGNVVALEVELDRFPDVGFDVLSGCCRADTARQIRRVGRKTGLRLFHDDQIFDHFRMPAISKQEATVASFSTRDPSAIIRSAWLYKLYATRSDGGRKSLRCLKTSQGKRQGTQQALSDLQNISTGVRDLANDARQDCRVQSLTLPYDNNVPTVLH
jgi:hypothetical protein